MPSEIPKIERALLQLICQTIYDKKGFNILTLDVRGVSTMADYFVIAEGNVERHVQALAGCVSDELAALKRKPLHTEGISDGDWVVLDYGDVIIHLMIPDMREYYALEQVWKEGRVVDVPVISPGR
jgi:ribosome-associated protein